MRIDTNKPPGDLVRSYQKQAEEAMLEASGREFLSKSERKAGRVRPHGHRPPRRLTRRRPRQRTAKARPTAPQTSRVRSGR